MRQEHSQILALLADGRISVAEAERLLALTGIGLGLSRSTLALLPAAGMGIVTALQHQDSIHAALHFLALRAAELAQLQHFHAL